MPVTRDSLRPLGRVTARHVASRNGIVMPVSEALSPKLESELRARGMRPEALFNNLVVNFGRGRLARMLGGASTTYINRIQLGDCLVSGVVRKDLYPADLSDVALVHEIRTISGNPGATFDLDSTTYPDEIVKVNRDVGTPGVLLAGLTSTLTDSGADFLAAGVTDIDTVTVYIGGESYTLGVSRVVSATQLEVENPNQLAAAVNYTVQTPGTQVLFHKLVNGDNFPTALFGPVTVVHEAGLLFDDGALFNRVTFQQQDNGLGLVFQPTDIDGTRIDVQLDWLITF
jgi:hypothetical protein